MAQSSIHAIFGTSSSQMSNLHPMAKRRREETSKDEIRKRDSLYFKNGDIVLLSLPCNYIITAFKVDKVYLMRHSPVFERMLSLPSPELVEKYDGVPLVHVQDEEKDLFPFLRALYDLSSLPYKKHGHDTIARVEGVLKLSIKYDVETLRKHIVNVVSADWPSDLASWDINEQEIAIIAGRVEIKEADEDSLDKILPEPCSAIRLARVYNLPGILPAAFYHLSRIPPFADLEKPSTFRDEEAQNKYLEHVFYQGRRARFGLLSPQDLMCLLKGTHSITQFVQDRAFEVMSQAQRNCKSKTPECRKALKAFRAAYESDLLGRGDALDILQSKDIDKPEGLCYFCGYTFAQRMRSVRSDLWDSLPKFFDL